MKTYTVLIYISRILAVYEVLLCNEIVETKSIKYEKNSNVLHLHDPRTSLRTGMKISIQSSNRDELLRILGVAVFFIKVPAGVLFKVYRTGPHLASQLFVSQSVC